jgi:ubiquinone/menaquinone biosynthesis C-methylase UbiE
MLQQARSKLGQHNNIQFQKQDAYNTSFDDSTFDAVLMVNLLHIVHDPTLILGECARVLGESGRVVVADVTTKGAPMMAGAQVGMRYMNGGGAARP